MAEPAASLPTRPGPAGLAVSLRGVSKVYDSGVAALGPLDLEVRSGEFVSLLGRSELPIAAAPPAPALRSVSCSRNRR